MNQASVFVLVLVGVCCFVSGFASSSQPGAPWRDPRYSYSSRPQQQQYYHRGPPIFEDYSSHFLDSDEWINDKRSRLFKIDLKSRQLGKVSLTSKIVATNLFTFVVQTFRPDFTAWGVKLSDRILRGQELHRLITPMFLHGNIFHLFTNLYSLQQVGPDVEKIFGPGRYAALYAASGIAGTLASAIQSPNPSLGASGAVFGVVGAYFVFLTRNAWLLGPVGESMSSSIAQTMLANVALGLFNPVIDNWAHLGGALGGAAMAYWFGPRLYVSEAPLGGGRILIDRPMIRLPRYIESMPEQVGKGWQRLARRMRVERYLADLPDTPWRSKNRPHRPPHRTQPGGSIKPRKF